MPQLVLTYFDMPGRARVLRRTLTLGGIAFEDRALSGEQIEALKPTLPYGMVPILTIDGHIVAESQAIVRYIGRLTGAYPKEPLAAALVDEILDSFDDLNERLLIPTYQEDDPAKKKTLRLRLVDGELREALRLLDQRLQHLQQLPLVPTHQIFVHELVVWDYATKFQSDGLEHIPTTFIHAFPTILALYNKIEHATILGSVSSKPSPTMTPRPSKLKLLSLKNAVPDRAMVVRIALHVAGLSFEDERISQDEFLQRKHEAPNAQLPILVTDDQIIAQSSTLLRYIGTIGEFYPAQDALAAVQMDEVVSHLAELYFFFDPIYQTLRPDAMSGIHKALAEDVVPESLEALDKRLTLWHPEPLSSFAMGGTSMTIVDLAIFAVVELLTSGELSYIPTTIVAPHKRLLCVHETVRQDPRVRECLAHAT